MAPGVVVALAKKKQLSMQDAMKEANLSKNEVSVALGTLKKKALIDGDLVTLSALSKKNK